MQTHGAVSVWCAAPMGSQHLYLPCSRKKETVGTPSATARCTTPESGPEVQATALHDGGELRDAGFARQGQQPGVVNLGNKFFQTFLFTFVRAGGNHDGQLRFGLPDDAERFRVTFKRPFLQRIGGS